MTLFVRDEADVLDAQLAYHLNAGVDFVIATDHDSRDGTTEILETYKRAGYLKLIRDARPGFRQRERVTRMARLAATEQRADWVILSDADEFWWPRGGDLKDVLSAVPARYGIIRAPQRYFLPRPDDGRFFAERMTVRLSAQAPINDPLNTYRPVAKIAYRAYDDVLVGQGNHALIDSPLALLQGWYPLDVLHFPQRSLSQFELKIRRVVQTIGEAHRGDFARAEAALGGGRLDERYSASVVDDVKLEHGLADDSLVVDVRLRDVLHDLRRTGGTGAHPFRLPHEGGAPLEFRRPEVADEATHAVDVATLQEASIVRLQRRLDTVGRQVGALERRSRPRLRR
jgi:Glycosyl transferase family 2